MLNGVMSPLANLIGYNIIVALTGLPIGYSVIVALTGLPIRYSVIVALAGLPIGYNGLCRIQLLVCQLILPSFHGTTC